MNKDALTAVQKIIEIGDEKNEIGEYGLARNEYLSAVSELENAKESSKEKDQLMTTVKDKLKAMDEKLAKANYEKGKAAVYTKSWELAIEHFEEAIRLAPEENIEFLERAKKQLDKAKAKSGDYQMYIDINSLVERGNDFKESGNYAEAILEYEAAYKIIANLPEDHKYVVFLKTSLTECRRNIIRPYLAKIYRAYNKKKFSHAATLLQKASNLIDKKDNVYKRFLDKINEKIAINIEETDVQSDEIDNSPVWEKAVKDYEEALDLYSSFVAVDPLAPAYNNKNIYEDKFVESRKKLGKLYKTRADNYRDSNKIDKAIKNYKEALRLLPKTDKMFHEAFSEIKKLRAQITENQ